MPTKKNDGGPFAWSLLRITMGYVFLWPFLDKLIGLGFSTCKDKVSGVVDIACKQSWLHGGSPTKGFLGHAATGPLANFYHGLAGQAWVDWLFMIGLVFVGLGLLFGTWIKAAAAAGIAMLLLMWSALLWPANTPGVDEHIVYVVVLVCIYFTVPTKFSLHSWWLKSTIVKHFSFLR